MKRNLICLLATALLVALPYKVEAQAKPQGFFLGAGASYAWENFDDDELTDLEREPGISNVDVEFDDAWGFNVFAGYKFMKYLALEANYNYYDDFEVDLDARVFGNSVSADADIEIWTVTADLLLMYPVFDDRLVPYLRFGGGYMDAEIDAGGDDDDENDLVMNLGGGIDYFLNEIVSLGLDGKYVWGRGDLDELEYFVGTVRLGFHF